jgi:DNA mismatch repair ATPase MutL
MRDEDVLISEYRVTVLGEKGQYIFDWVNEDARTVKFIESESDFDDFNREVENVLNQNGVSIIKSDADATDSSNESDTEYSMNKDDSETLEPVDKSEQNKTLEETNDGFQPIEEKRDEDNTNNTTDGTETTDRSENDDDKDQLDSSNGETFSFIVRMSDPSERRNVINEIRKINEECADQLELSGPFKVTYKVTETGIKLVHVEDMGLGTEIGSTE